VVTLAGGSGALDRMGPARGGADGAEEAAGGIPGASSPGQPARSGPARSMSMTIMTRRSLTMAAR
jgi:hypothetical protein